MGLVARILEASGIATVCLSMIPELTRATGAPRVAGIAYPISRPMGRPGDADGQRSVLASTLDLLATARTPGANAELPHAWHESPARARRGSDASPPIARLLTLKPWLLPRLYSGEIPDER